MFERSYNRAVLRVRIDTVTPLLIRAGDAGLDPTAADLTCVRTSHARRGKMVYIPGSSLKGVLRAAAEAGVRGRTFQGDTSGACNPLTEDGSCWGKIDRARREAGRRNGIRQPPSSPEIHRAHCLACRLFGSLAIKGRASVRDLFPWDERATDARGPEGDNQKRANELEMRHSVAIDRVAGSARHGHGPFDQEMVPAGVSFWGEITLENYQAWQLGLLAQGLAQIHDGFAQLGSSKSRGLGVATVAIEGILHEQVPHRSGRPAGVGVLMEDERARARYGLLADRMLPEAERTPHGLAERFTATGGEHTKGWLDAGLEALGGLR